MFFEAFIQTNTFIIYIVQELTKNIIIQIQMFTFVIERYLFKIKGTVLQNFFSKLRNGSSEFKVKRKIKERFILTKPYYV